MNGGLIDCQENGLGDVIVGCWVMESARAAGYMVRLNPRKQLAIASVLVSNRNQLTDESGASWTLTVGFGLQYEYERAPHTSLSRFDLWCASLQLPGLTPVRPPYTEAPADACWAEDQWRRIDRRGSPRVVLFPSAAWRVRVWPRAYYMDVAAALMARGVAVVTLGQDKESVERFPSDWMWGFEATKVAALVRRADLVLANDSGPAHLAGTIGVLTVAICGPTRGAVVFGHDPNVRTVSFDPAALPCVGCHFSAGAGYRQACEDGGCQALMRLAPKEVLEFAIQCLDGRSRPERAPQ